MAKSSMHVGNGKSNFLMHNSRESNSLSQVFFDEENEVFRGAKEAKKFYEYELNLRSSKYQKRTGQKIQKKTVTHLSSVINLEKHHTLDDLKLIIDFLENELDTKVIQVAIHRDEGMLVNTIGEVLTSGENFFCDPKSKKLFHDKKFTDPIDMGGWEVVKNYHAHIEFMGIDSEGSSIRRKMNTRFLRRLQDVAAESLQMERGTKIEPRYTKEEMKQIRAALHPKSEYKTSKAYAVAFERVARELGLWKPKKRQKRLDTHQYKRAKAAENELLATKKLLDATNRVARTNLQVADAVRADYAKLEGLKERLHERIRERDLTVRQLEEAFQELEGRLNQAKSENDGIKIEQEEVKEELACSQGREKGLKEALEVKIEETKTLKSRLYEAEEELEDTQGREKGLKEALEVKDVEIKELQKENSALKYMLEGWKKIKHKLVGWIEGKDPGLANKLSNANDQEGMEELDRQLDNMRIIKRKIRGPKM